MIEDQTISVSKGVFVLKNGYKPASKKFRKQKGIMHNNVFSTNLWYESYISSWEFLEEQIEELNNSMFSSVFISLVDFLKNAYNDIETEIPTSALLTGINMPDHKVQFSALSKEIKQNISPHVAYLCSQDCQNLKYLVENMIHQFVNKEETDDKVFLKKHQFSFSFLQSWYEDLYLTKSALKSPKKTKTETKRNILVIIIPDFESCNPKVLQDFISITSSYISILPFVLVFGIATSLSVLHSSLPYHVSSKMNVNVFNLPPSTVYLNNVLEETLFAVDCPFQLGGKNFNLFTDIFLFYDLSIIDFIQNIKYAMLEHYCFGNVMALCHSDMKFIKKTLHSFTHEDCENARHILSFRKLVEHHSHEKRIKLLTDDNYFKSVLEGEIKKLQRYIRRLHIFLKCLCLLVKDLPKAPLGKQVRELYAVAATKNITKTEEYKECFQLLNFQSKNELCLKLSEIIHYVKSVINDQHKGPNKLKDFVIELETFLNAFNVVALNDVEVEDKTQNTQPISGQMDRKQLKEKLLGMSKQSSIPLNKFEKIREKTLTFLSDTFEIYLIEPSAMYFYEIYFFDDISIQNRIVGSHRSAIHTALNDPQFFLQCNCCEIPNKSAIRTCMPDVCIAYKLHLEYGKMINLYDWLQAFLTIVDPTEVDDESRRVVKPELQARFTQSVTQMEYLGFIKSSNRKADHVARLTWGE